MTPLLYIVLPCFNCGEVIPFSVKFYKDKLEELSLCGKISALSKILLIDNGSTDNTWQIISETSQKNPCVGGIKLGRYSGKTGALICGVENAQKYCDIIIVADCGCRKDINAIDRMIEEYEKGSRIVFGKEEKKKFFGRLKNYAPGYDFEYFLISKEVTDELEKYTECELNLKKILTGMNFGYSCVYYNKRNTFAIKESFSFKKVWECFRGFFNAYTFPIHLIFALGCLTTAAFLSMLLCKAVMNVFGAVYNIGKAFIDLMSALEILSMGVIGEYLIKIINETKKHPRYTVVDATNGDKNSTQTVSKTQDIV